MDSNFLSNRRQRICVRGSASSWSTVISGVPQGSVLGPILLIVYMNYLPDVITSNLWEFADDTKLYHCISSLSDWTLLQTDLDNFMNWFITWHSSVNIDKCKHMTHYLQMLTFLKFNSVLKSLIWVLH